MTPRTIEPTDLSLAHLRSTAQKALSFRLLYRRVERTCDRCEGVGTTPTEPCRHCGQVVCEGCRHPDGT